MSIDNPNDDIWEATTTDDLIELNRYARDKILKAEKGRFFPMQSRWFASFGPGISDGR